MQKKKYESPMDAALSYLTARMRTKAETEERLRQLGYGDEEIQQTLDRLCELRLIDDGAYASEYLRTRTAAGHFSRKVLKYQMMKHKLEKEQIDEALETVGPEEEHNAALKIARREWKNRSSLDKTERKNKVFAKLCRRGFDMDTVLTVCREISQEEEEETDDL